MAAHPEPNAAHRAIAGLERSGVAVRVITQNVDGLTPRVLTRLQREFTEGSARV